MQTFSPPEKPEKLPKKTGLTMPIAESPKSPTGFHGRSSPKYRVIDEDMRLHWLQLFVYGFDQPDPCQLYLLK